MNEDKLAIELLHELKMSAKRWFIAFVIMTVLEILTIVGFLWYITLPVEQTSVEQEMEKIEDSTATQMIGGEYSGKNETEDNL